MHESYYMMKHYNTTKHTMHIMLCYVVLHCFMFIMLSLRHVTYNVTLYCTFYIVQ